MNIKTLIGMSSYFLSTLPYLTMRRKLPTERTKTFRQNSERLWAKQVRALGEAERAFERKSESLWTKHWNPLI